MAVTAIGWRAHAALRASGGRAEVVAQLSTSVYATAAGELIWIGPPGSPLHARSVAMSDAAAVLSASTRLMVDGVDPWRPLPLPVVNDRREAQRILDDTVIALGEPRGLARLRLPSAGDDLVTTRARPHA